VAYSIYIILVILVSFEELDFFLIFRRKGLRNHLLGKHAEVDAETARKLSGYGRRTDIMKCKSGNWT